MLDFSPSEAWHAEDVLAALADGLEQGKKTTLGLVTETVGGGVRRPGTLIGVMDETLIGYVSHGCVDDDVVAQAIEACAEGRPRLVQYGEGSPYQDIKLPCAGAVSVHLEPQFDWFDLQLALATLTERQVVHFSLVDGHIKWGNTGPYRLLPKPRLVIAGRGGEALALIRLALVSRFGANLLSPDELACDAASKLGAKTYHLRHLKDDAPLPDDPFTAFVLLFHDHEWEASLLERALERPFFYFGALGSHRAQQYRREQLLSLGVSTEKIDQIRGPIGLVPKTRDSAMLAVSALAEIVDAYEDLLR